MKNLLYVMCLAIAVRAVPSAADYHDTVSKSFQVGGGIRLSEK